MGSRRCVDAVIGLRVDLSELDATAAALAAHRELRYVGISTGEFDILLEGVFASQQDLRRFLTECIGRLRGVRDSRTFVVLHAVKYGPARGEAPLEDGSGQPQVPRTRTQ